MTSELILFVYALQALSYLALASYFAYRLWRNHLTKQFHLIVWWLFGAFGTQGVIYTYRLYLRAQALAEGRPTGIDSWGFAALVAVNAACLIGVLVVFRNNVESVT